MFKFEIKKLFKRKLFLIIIIAAVILSYNNVNKVSSIFYTNMYLETKESPAAVMDFLSMEKIEQLKIDGEIEQAELLEERFNSFRNISEEIRILSLKALEEEGLNKEINKEYIVKSNEKIEFFYEMAKDFHIELTQSQKDSIEWNFMKNNLLIENKSYEVNIKDQYNLGRFFRFGIENLFGIVSLLLLAFLSLDSLPKEYENGTIITPYTQPFKKYKIIFAKLFSFMIISGIYILSAISFTIIFTKIKGYPLTGLSSISRFVADQMLYVKTWQYLLWAILSFSILSLLIYSFVLFIGSVTKNSIKTMAIVSTSIIVLYLVTKSGYLESIFNPFYLLNYSDILIGKFQYPFTGINLDFIYIQHNAKGYIPYFYMLIPTALFLFLSIAFQNIIKRKKSKDKTVLRKKPLKSLYSFEFKKIKEFSSPFFILLMTVIVIATIFSIRMVDDINIIRDKKGSEGEVALQRKILEHAEKELKETKTLAESEDMPHEVRLKAEMSIELSEENFKKAEGKYKLDKDIYDAYDKQDSEKFYTNLRKTIFEKFRKDGQYTWSTYEGATGRASEFSFITSYERLKELSKRNIKPILQTERQDTYYDKFLDPQEESRSKLYNKPLSHSGFYSIFRLYEDYYLSYIILFFITLFFCGGYAYDTEIGNQIVFLYTEPIDRKKYHYNKIFSSILISVIFLIAFYTIILLFGNLTEGLGDFNYPILQYDKVVENPYALAEDFQGSYHFINIFTYILKTILIGIFSIGFIASLTTFLSIKLKSKNYIVFSTFMILLVGTFITSKINIDLIQLILPFPYLNIGRLADGSVKVIYDNNSLSMLTGIMVLTLWSILLSIFGMDLTENREIK